MLGLMKKTILNILILLVTSTGLADEKLFWIKIPAVNKYQRSEISDLGLSIEVVEDDYVIALGSEDDIRKLKQKRRAPQVTFEIQSFEDFPKKDSRFHNYDETKKVLNDLVSQYPNLAQIEVVGKSIEGRDILGIVISQNPAQAFNKPGIVFTGAHHAREHLSTEIPLLLAQTLLEQYSIDPQITQLVNNRQIFILPMINPDGAEYDISTGSYKMWRKNRRANRDGTYGVDLNRNYGYAWGTGGSSTTPRSDIFMGLEPFSEPESQAVRSFIEKHQNISILLSYHTFSKLILFPWGWSYDTISSKRDEAVFKKMASDMAVWNGYKPQQSSALYIASGDTCDWAYAEHHIFSFTFELDPESLFEGGFYPGQDIIQPVFQKNLKPALYLIDLADNPYRVLNASLEFGLQSPILR